MEHKEPTSSISSDENEKGGRPVESEGLDRPTPAKRRVVGDYALGKNLTSDSFGKVKMAEHVATGQKFAISIRSARHKADSTGTTCETPEDVDARVRQEAALGKLLHHPHIARMKELIVTRHHYYLVHEYTGESTLLDYVIAHGRLRERVARKLGRQLGGALQYCHDNNVIHRDVKIENVFISEDGDLKLTGFSMAGLFEPNERLTKYCGSLYFAAPEMLKAEPYDSLKVDAWSLGVLLYILVCGKVPFDDVSIEGLREKVKTANVAFPSYLSSGCKDLLSRLLRKDPAKRASIHEALSHKWMLKGYAGPPWSPLSCRSPLPPNHPDAPTPLHPAVIAEMKGFHFGTAEQIESKLRDLLGSDKYRNAVARSQVELSEELSKWETKSDHSLDEKSHEDPNTISGIIVHPRTKVVLDLSSGSTLPTLTYCPSIPPQYDPTAMATPDTTRGFHPLLSIYLLAQESVERRHIQGDHFPPKFNDCCDNLFGGQDEEVRPYWRELVRSLACWRRHAE